MSKKINKKNKGYTASKSKIVWSGELDSLGHKIPTLKSKEKIPFIMLKLPGCVPVSSNDKSVSKFFKKIH